MRDFLLLIFLNHFSLLDTAIAKHPPHPNCTRRPPALIITEGVKDKKQNKMKIRIGSVVKEKFG